MVHFISVDVQAKHTQVRWLLEDEWAPVEQSVRLNIELSELVSAVNEKRVWIYSELGSYRCELREFPAPPPEMYQRMVVAHYGADTWVVAKLSDYLRYSTEIAARPNDQKWSTWALAGGILTIPLALLLIRYGGLVGAGSAGATFALGFISLHVGGWAKVDLYRRTPEVLAKKREALQLDGFLQCNPKLALEALT